MSTVMHSSNALILKQQESGFPCLFVLTQCRLSVAVRWSVHTAGPGHQTALVPHGEGEVTWQPSLLGRPAEQTALTARLQRKRQTPDQSVITRKTDRTTPAQIHWCTSNDRVSTGLRESKRHYVIQLLHSKI